jgi:hypothetical protein
VPGSRIRAAKTERIGARPRSTAVLIGAGLAFQALRVVFTLLYVNVPPGFNVPYGLCLHSVGLFRKLWSYPTVSLSATAFSRRGHAHSPCAVGQRRPEAGVSELAAIKRHIIRTFCGEYLAPCGNSRL